MSKANFTAHFIWKNIKKLVMDSFSYSYENENMSISQKQSIITLLPQKNNDVRFLKSWRPISLLNTDYKIMTKCIATRLKNNLIKIIYKNQSGFIKGRYIGDNIRSLLEVINLAEEENLSCIVLSIDFEKAFDTISWKLKKNVFPFLIFVESFQQWINKISLI
jgi:hypothetical protein